MQTEKTLVKNRKGTFLVNICYCENSTWQGHVVWAEKNKKEYFRSALELIKILDDAMEQSSEDAQYETEMSDNNKAVNER